MAILSVQANSTRTSLVNKDHPYPDARSKATRKHMSRGVDGVRAHATDACCKEWIKAKRGHLPADNCRRSVSLILLIGSLRRNV